MSQLFLLAVGVKLEYLEKLFKFKIMLIYADTRTADITIEILLKVYKHFETLYI